MRMRSFTWADLPALVELVRAVRKTEGDGRIVNESSLKEELSIPGLDPERDCTLFEDEKSFLAYSILHTELRIGRTILEIGVHLDHNEKDGLERAAVRAGLAYAKSLGAGVLHVCVPPSEFWTDLLKEEGFSQVREYWMMKWQDESVPSVELPQGFSIEGFQPGDEERLTRVQNASFTGSWGFCPNTIEEVSYLAGMSICTPDGILFLAHGAETAGYCWTSVLGDARNPVGVIWMIGVAPAYRGQGLGNPILMAGMEYLKSRGVGSITLDVDGGNTLAIKLYTSVGFEKALEVHWFEAELSGG